MSTNTDRATKFFFEKVEPTVEQFLDNAGDESRAFEAASKLSSMADYHWNYSPAVKGSYRSAEAYRAALSPAGSDYAVLADVANAGKHAILTREPRHRALTLDGEEDVAASEPTLDSTWITCDTTRVRLGDNVVMVTLKDGTKRPFYPFVERVMAMWQARLGLI